MSWKLRTRAIFSRQAVVLGALLVASVFLGGRPAEAVVGVVYAVYVTNCGNQCGGPTPGTISAYLVNETTGALTEVDGSPFSAGFAPAGIAARPSGTQVYVVNESYEGTGSGPGTLSAFATLSSGGLSPMAPAIRAGWHPVAVVVDPSDQYIYVANSGSDDISAYVIDKSGYPQTILGSPFPAGSVPRSLAVHPTGQFLYVANSGPDATVSGYRIDAATGALTQLPNSPFYVGPDAESIAIIPSGQRAYIAHSGGDSLSAWALNLTSGGLSLVGYARSAGSPISVAAIQDSVTRQQLVYVANSVFGNISAFWETLTPVDGSPFPMSFADYPQSVAVDPIHQFLYVASLGRTVSAFTINGMTGQLTEVVGSPFTAGVHPRGVTAVAVPIPGGTEP